MRFGVAVSVLLAACVSTPEPNEEAPDVDEVLVDTLPVIPVIGGTVRARVLEIMSSPAAALNHRDAFAKVGDSITETGSYLKDNGCALPPDPRYYGSHTDVIPSVSYFTARAYPSNYANAWCGISNTFTRASHVAMSGATSAFALSATTLCAAPNNTRVRCEYELMRPAFAIIMFGTNDALANVDRALVDALATYRANMQAIIDSSVAMGVVPVLSTIPPLIPSVGNVTQAQADRVGAYNQTVADLAEANNIPLLNYNRALVELGSAANYGVSSDGIHPSIYNGSDGGNFTDAALRFGYNQRNLTSIQMLHALKLSVIDTASAPVWNTTALPDGVVGAAYTATVSASGNPAPTYAATGLPPGLVINATSGVISGTPSASGAYSVALTAANGQIPDAITTLSLTVNTVASTGAAPTITTTTLPAATLGATYAATVSATGTPAPTFAATGLPAGLAINATTGAISGTPSVAGSFSVVVTATNGVSPDASRTLALTVSTAATVAPTITTTTLPAGALGTAYSATVVATGTPAPTFSATGLPAGLSINTTSGVIFGTPTASGTFSVAVTARNGTLPDASRTLSLAIAAQSAPRITSAPPPDGTRNVYYSFTVTASGSPRPTFSATGLPRGLTIDRVTGTIFGTPTRTGTYDVRVRASNGIAPNAEQRDPLVIR